MIVKLFAAPYSWPMTIIGTSRWLLWNEGSLSVPEYPFEESWAESIIQRAFGAIGNGMVAWHIVAASHVGMRADIVSFQKCKDSGYIPKLGIWHFEAAIHNRTARTPKQQFDRNFISYTV